MSYNSLSECTLDPAERLEEAGRIVNMLTAKDEVYFKLSLKERSFIDGMRSSCSVKQLFWLRDIWERVQCPICILETKRYGTRAEAVAAWNHRPVEDALVKAIDDYRWAATFSPSCQKGVVENCRCLKCASERLDAALKMAKEGR